MCVCVRACVCMCAHTNSQSYKHYTITQLFYLHNSIVPTPFDLLPHIPSFPLRDYLCPDKGKKLHLQHAEVCPTTINAPKPMNYSNR